MGASQSGYDVKVNKQSVGYCKYSANQTNSNSGLPPFPVSVKEGDEFSADAICPCTPNNDAQIPVTCPEPANAVFYYYPGITKLDSTKDGFGVGQPKIGNGTFKGPFAQSGLLIVYDGPPLYPLSSYVAAGNNNDPLGNIAVVMSVQGLLQVNSSGINSQYVAIGIGIFVLLVIIKARASSSSSTSAGYTYPPYTYPPYAPPPSPYSQYPQWPSM